MGNNTRCKKWPWLFIYFNWLGKMMKQCRLTEQRSFLWFVSGSSDEKTDCYTRE
jgi:hypothetical protein